mgnify:CR=1 FL=1
MRAEKIFKLAKGFRGRAKNTIRAARNRVEKALQYQYRDRKAKKREFRELWIQQINAATREHGVRYGEFMHGLKQDNVVVDRKILAELAQGELSWTVAPRGSRRPDLRRFLTVAAVLAEA